MLETTKLVFKEKKSPTQGTQLVSFGLKALTLVSWAPSVQSLDEASILLSGVASVIWD